MALPLLEPEIFHDNHFKMLFFAISSLLEVVEDIQWYILKGLRVVPDDVQTFNLDPIFDKMAPKIHTFRNMTNLFSSLIICTTTY